MEFKRILLRRYFDLREDDLDEANLLIVAGTSLKVAPFSHTMNLCHPAAPRLLINMERVGMPDPFSGGGFQFDSPNNYRDVEMLGSCDECVMTLCEMVGWREELEALIVSKHPTWQSPWAGIQLTAAKAEMLRKDFRAPPGAESPVQLEQESARREMMAFMQAHQSDD